MDVSEAKRLKDLERENSELKKIVADLTLDNRMLKNLNSKKMVSLAERRRGAERLEAAHGVSERRACQMIGLWRSSKRRPSGRIEEANVDFESFSTLFLFSRYRTVAIGLRPFY